MKNIKTEKLLRSFAQPRSVAMALVVCALIVYPLVVPDFFAYQIGGYSLILGTIALALMVLAGYGGMVNLAQPTVAGISGYLMAILGTNSAHLGLDWPWWIVVPMAIAGGTICGAFIGAIAVRTRGIYTIMITLAVSVVFFYLVRQNYTIFNGFTGFAGIHPPTIGGIYLRDPVPFYYLALFVACSFYGIVLWTSRSAFGLALQAIRDNPRRMNSLGFHVIKHRILASMFAGCIAATGGVLLVWFNGRISPGSVSLNIVIDILVIAIIGGLRHPVGPFLGALLFVLLENFAIDLIDRDRFNTVIGVIFLLIVFLSPDGILGLIKRLAPRVSNLLATLLTQKK